MALRTKEALAEALKKLLNRRPLDKITVKDIVEEAGVNRQTFYYHFQDIYDLLRWMFEQRAQEMLARVRDEKSLQEEFAEVLCIIQNEKPLILNAYRSVSREHLEQYILAFLERFLRPMLEADPLSAKLTEEEQTFILNFYKHALVGLLVGWIREGMKGEADLLTERTHRLMDGEVHRALLRFLEEKEGT